MISQDQSTGSSPARKRNLAVAVHTQPAHSRSQSRSARKSEPVIMTRVAVGARAVDRADTRAWCSGSVGEVSDEAIDVGPIDEFVGVGVGGGCRGAPLAEEDRKIGVGDEAVV